MKAIDKIAFSLVCIIFSSGVASSQEREYESMFSIGREAYFDVCYPSQSIPDALEIHRVEDKVIIGDKECWMIPFDGYVENGETYDWGYYIYEDGFGKGYIIHPHNFPLNEDSGYTQTLLFDFNLEEGDVINRRDPGDLLESTYLRVSKTLNIDINGETRKCLLLEGMPLDGNPYPAIWIEGIGMYSDNVPYSRYYTTSVSETIQYINEVSYRRIDKIVIDGVTIADSSTFEQILELGNNISTIEDSKTDKYFSLDGLPIVHPRKGDVIIDMQTGKKTIRN